VDSGPSSLEDLKTVKAKSSRSSTEELSPNKSNKEILEENFKKSTKLIKSLKNFGVHLNQPSKSE